MTPELYVIALKASVKQFPQIPPDMMSEDACVELVKDSGWRLEIVDGDERRVTRIRLLPPPEPVAAEA